MICSRPHCLKEAVGSFAAGELVVVARLFSLTPATFLLLEDPIAALLGRFARSQLLDAIPTQF